MEDAEERERQKSETRKRDFETLREEEEEEEEEEDPPSSSHALCRTYNTQYQKRIIHHKSFFALARRKNECEHK